MTDDVKSYPIKIIGVEVYAMSRKDFGYRDKLKKLEIHNVKN